MGKMPFDSGTVTVGHNVDPVLFEQDQDRSLTPTKTILDEVEDSCKTSEIRARVRAMLGAFLFPGDDVRKKIAVLSGGEKNRVAMVNVLLAQGNLLLLDEPTNHLDLPSKEILLSALQQFTGTLLFVSHDRSFLDSLATRIIELTPTGAKSYPGNYESYLYQKKVNEQLASGKVATAENQAQRPSRGAPVVAGSEKGGREAYELRKKRANLESRIAKLEREIEDLTEKFGELEYDSKEYAAADDRLTLLRQQLSNAYTEWEKWSL
jgi:ATP-binding cassette subfamily F protein 3